MSLENLFENLPLEKITEMVAQLKKTADALDLPFGVRTMTFNSRLAQELGLWAETQGQGPRFHLEAFKAYFSHGHNLAREAVLLDIASEVGLPVEDARAVLRQRSFAEHVDHDWRYGREKHIRAVPTFMINDDAVVGAQPYAELENLMLRHMIPKRGKATPG